MSYPLRSCHRCGKGFFSSYKEHLCQDCLKELEWEPTPYTNADHIRSMTDEELAELLLNGNATLVCPNGCDGCNGDCEGRMLDWLKQPYGGDT